MKLNRGAQPALMCSVNSRFIPVAGLLVLFWTSTAFGLINLDSTSSTSAVTPPGNQITWSHTVGSGSNQILVVGVSLRRFTSIEQVSSVTYGSQALTFIGANNSTDKNFKYRAELWYRLAPASGTNTITVQFSGAVGSTVGGAASFTGVNQTTALGTFAAAGGVNPSTPSVTVSSAAGEIVIDTVSARGLSLTITPGTNQSQLWNKQSGI